MPKVKHMIQTIKMQQTELPNLMNKLICPQIHVTSNLHCNINMWSVPSIQFMSPYFNVLPLLPAALCRSIWSSLMRSEPIPDLKNQAVHSSYLIFTIYWNELEANVYSWNVCTWMRKLKKMDYVENTLLSEPPQYCQWI